MPLTTKSGVKIRHTKHGNQYIEPGELLSKKSVREKLKSAGKAFDRMQKEHKEKADAQKNTSK